MNSNSAYSHSIKLLSAKDYSKPKLILKLLARGHEVEEIEETIRTLIEKNYLREDLYIEARVKGLAKKGCSIRHIIYRLKKENLTVTKETIQEIYQEFEISDLAILEDLIEKKRNSILRRKPNLTYGEVFQKLATFLNTKGYSAYEHQDIIKAIISAKQSSECNT